MSISEAGCFVWEQRPAVACYVSGLAAPSGDSRHAALYRPAPDAGLEGKCETASPRKAGHHGYGDLPEGLGQVDAPVAAGAQRRKSESASWLLVFA